jgi:cell division protein FtsA
MTERCNSCEQAVSAVVLTGGACQLGGARELAGRILNKQVRLGRPTVLRGMPDSVSGPASATAAGLLAWSAGWGRMINIDLGVEEPSGLWGLATFRRKNPVLS